jgi:hypothetical protein
MAGVPGVNAMTGVSRCTGAGSRVTRFASLTSGSGNVRTRARSKLCHPRTLPVTQQIAFKRELVQRRIDGVAGNRELLRQRARAGWLPD